MRGVLRACSLESCAGVAFGCFYEDLPVDVCSALAVIFCGELFYESALFFGDADLNLPIPLFDHGVSLLDHSVLHF